MTRLRKCEEGCSGELCRAHLIQIIDMNHELVRLADEIDWDGIDDQVAHCIAAEIRPGIETRFLIGVLPLKQIYGLSDEGVWEPGVHNPYFEHFTCESFFQHAIPHGRSGVLSRSAAGPAKCATSCS